MTDPAGRRVTTADVAREAGVSRATVSYALNGDPQGRLTVETRRLVRRTADRLGYQPSAAARLLRGGRSRTVLALSAPEDGYGGLMGEVFERFSAGLAGHGYSLVWQLAVPGAPRPVGELTPAVVITAATADDPVFASFASGFDVPVIPAFEGRDAFLGAAARRQVDHLADQGHRQIAFVGPADPQLRSMASLRRSAARRAARRRDLTWVPDLRLPSDRSQAAALLSQSTEKQDTLAICAYNDDVALFVLAAARDAGVPVPGSLAVIGVDDVPAAATSSPALTSVRADLDDFVSESVEAFVAAAEGRTFQAPQLPRTFTVVARGSA
ncbi:LacI family transcriptional regulator [Kineosporia sp. NBRC 101677]|uniref:LacI family DNA-binding transcriptional regulator n=1 Tax=Kineosporia sp. NBRC 101677 TaxID=3032197 RepID=UPI00249FBB63|nr:LacI family DNA-binding transcriptional regulator [Kineosporia sp. NBRC 101677]GLY18925.1 LacI family transcriptional regulator [Kineosporia sp. NBRC 101677]